MSQKYQPNLRLYKAETNGHIFLLIKLAYSSLVYSVNYKLYYLYMINEVILGCFGEDFNNKYAELIAHELLNNTILSIEDTKYKIIEISFHYYTKNRKDYLSKRLYRQKNPKFRLIQHKTKGERGTYPGIDLTFGKPNSYGGIFIRQLQNTKNGDPVYGSTNVGKLLKKYFKNKGDSVNPFDSNSLVKFESDGNTTPKLISSTTRFSYKLNIKTDDKEEEFKWFFENLNFTVGKVSCQQNWDLIVAASQIVKRSRNCPLLNDLASPTRQRINELLSQGMQQTNFMDLLLNTEQSKDELVQLYGAWLKNFKLNKK